MIKDLNKMIDKEIVIDGFIDKIRNLQYVAFIILRDNTGFVQITILKDNMSESNDLIDHLTLESTIKVTGKVVSNTKVKLNGLEIIPSNILVTSKALPLPIDYKNKHNILRETRLDYRFLDLRRRENFLLFKCQSFIEHAMREYFIDNDYVEIHTPKIGKNGAESGAEMFSLDYFDQKAYLSQSPQFYKQMAIASGFNKVFEIGPVFRAENSHTSYHATEILMIDVEIANVSEITEVMKEEERWIKYFMNKLVDKYSEEIKEILNISLKPIDYTFPQIDFYEVKKILKNKYNSGLDDLDRQEEKLIGDYVLDKYNSDFVFITNYPYSARSFYVMQDDGTTKSYDLLYKGIEITSGAIREHRYETLKEQIMAKGYNVNNFLFYLDFFKYGVPPHGGFGVGMNRLLMRLFEIDNIREATFIYRGPTRLEP